MAVVIVPPYAGERFVYLVAEDIAEVGDRPRDFEARRCGDGIERETADDHHHFAVL